MTPPTGQPEPSSPVGDLSRRLDSLGLAIGWFTSQGRLTGLDPSHWLESMIARSQRLVRFIQQHHQLISGSSSGAVEAMPGLWLAPLPVGLDDSGGGAADGPWPVVILVCPEFLDSEAFFLLCDLDQLDRQAVLDRVDRSALVETAQVQPMARMLAWMARDQAQISRQDRELGQFSIHLGDAYEELSLLHTMSSGLTINQEPAQRLTRACEQFRQGVGLRWVAIWLADSGAVVSGLAGRLFTAGDTGCSTRQLKRMGEAMVDQLDSPHPCVWDDTHNLQVAHLPRLAGQLLGTRLAHGDQLFGVLIGGDKHGGSQITSFDTHLCASLASGLSLYLKNTRLYEDVQAMFMGTMHALTRAIDAKDSYTHGHSERVALLAQLLAQAVGLDAATVERVHIAGLVHDLGKIGVPEAVLCKTGTLSDHEFGLIKKHPEIGAQILSGIPQMQDLIPGVMCHHERWDGQGYPHQIAGEAIPLFGRLISLADAFDAMTSNRTYRAPLPHEEVIEEIRRCSGTQFDPHLADVFVRLDFGLFFEEAARHLARHAA